jgi:CRP-like cAMP-binding protein
MTQVDPASFRSRFPALVPTLDADAIQTFLDSLEVQQLAPSEALVVEDTPVDDLFLVWDGELDVSVMTPMGDRRVGHVGRGSFLGEVSLLHPGPATATVTAEQGCTVLRLSRVRFDELCDEHPRVAAAILTELGRTLAERLRHGVAVLAGEATGRPPAPDAEQVLSVHTALHRPVGG